MSKFLLNLLVQISKAMVYSKINFYSEKYSPGHFRPTRPFGPIFFFFYRPIFLPSPTGPRPSGRPSPPHGPPAGLAHRMPSSSSRTDAGRTRRLAAGRPRAASPVTPTLPPEEKKRPHLIPLHFPPLIGAIPPSSIPETGAFNPTIEASSNRPLKALGPPPPRLRPINADPTPGEAPHTSKALSPSPHRAFAVVLPSRALRCR
jgi:hypothetical protein